MRRRRTRKPACASGKVARDRVLRLALNAALVVLLAAIAYEANRLVLRAPFVSDDRQIFLSNAFMPSPARALEYFRFDRWREWHVLPSPYRPLREVLLANMRDAFRADPRPYHHVDLWGHALNTGLVYLVAQRVLLAWPPALFAALVFGLHPAHVEAVTWIKNVGEIWAAFFALLAALAWSGWMGPPANEVRPGGRGARVAWLTVSVLLLCVSLLFKEAALALPLILGAWALLLAPRGGRLRAASGAAPMLLALVIYMVAQFHVTRFSHSGEFSNWHAPTGLWPRGVLVLDTYARYLRILVLPLSLRSWYDGAFLGGEPVRAQAALCLGALGLAAAWLRAARRWPVGALAAFWVLAALGPASNLMVNTGRPLAEQRLYFPLAGFALLCGAVAALFTGRRLRWWGGALAIVLLGAYFLLLQDTLACWRSERRLWLRTGRSDPNLVYVMRMRQGLGHLALKDFRSAERSFRLGVRLRPGDYRSHFQRAVALWNLGERDAALRELRRARDLAPDKASARAELGVAYLQMGLYTEALSELETAHRLSPDGPILAGDVAKVLAELGRRDAARALWWRSLELCRDWARKEPGTRAAWVNLCRAAAALGLRKVADDAWARAERLRRPERRPPDFGPEVEARPGEGRVGLVLIAYLALLALVIREKARMPRRGGSPD